MAAADVQQAPAEVPAPDAAPGLPDYVLDPNAVLGDKDAQWRYGRAPDYSKTRKVWEECKSTHRCLATSVQPFYALVTHDDSTRKVQACHQSWPPITFTPALPKTVSCVTTLKRSVGDCSGADTGQGDVLVAQYFLRTWY